MADDKQKEYVPPPPPAPGYPVAAPNPLSMLGAQQLQKNSEWSTGLFGCLSDWETCLLTWWCPCISFGRIAEIVDRGSSSCGMSGAMYVLIMMTTGLQCLYSCTYRQKLRKQYGLKVSPCSDICVHFLCEPCAICQAYRELKNRGIDMALGWHGNVEKIQCGGMIQPPPVQGAMIR